MSSSREQDFLQSLARHLSFTGKRFDIFMARFKQEYQGRTNTDLAQEILPDDQNQDQVFQDHLREIMDSLKDDGLNLPPLKRGRQKKGAEPWLRAFRWIWDDKFPEWEAENSRSSVVSSISFEEWQQICQKVLKDKRQPNINELLRSEGAQFDVDDLFIPLGLVEKKQTRSRREDIASPAQGSHFYELPPEEVVRRFDRADEFFETVIQAERSSKSRIIIIGEPGAGKTTLLQKIAEKLPENVLPVWVSLADLRDYTLDEYLFGGVWWSQVDKTLPSEVGQEFRQLFANGRVCLLLDGVDEMSIPENQKGRSQLRVIYEQVKGWGDRVRVIMTCRVNVWEADPHSHEFEMYRNLSLEYPEQVEQYIDNFFRNPDLSVQSGEELKAELMENDRVQDTVKNPLRLALLCHAWLHCGGKLPDTQAGLYEMFLEAFYEIKKKEFPIDPDQRDALNNALGQLALEALDREQSHYRIDRTTAQKVLGHPDQLGSYFDQALGLGLLNKIGYLAEDPSQECYAFIHPTFQEYLAALQVESWFYFFNHNNNTPNPFKDYRDLPCSYRVFDDKWYETIIFWIDHCAPNLETKKQIFSDLLDFESGCEIFIQREQHFLVNLLQRNIVEWYTEKYSELKYKLTEKYTLPEVDLFEYEDTADYLNENLDTGFWWLIGLSRQDLQHIKQISMKLNSDNFIDENYLDFPDIKTILEYLRIQYPELVQFEKEIYNTIFLDTEFIESLSAIQAFIFFHKVLTIKRSFDHDLLSMIENLHDFKYIIIFFGLCSKLEFPVKDKDTYEKIVCIITDFISHFNCNLYLSILIRYLYYILTWQSYTLFVNDPIVLNEKLCFKLFRDLRNTFHYFQLFEDLKYEDKFMLEELVLSCNISGWNQDKNKPLIEYQSYRRLYLILYLLDSNLSYPRIYEACHSQFCCYPEVTPIGSTPQTQQLDRQFFNLQNQLIPTDTTYPLVLDLSSLQNLNDRAELCQEIVNLSYEAIDPNFEELDIPENIQNPAQLKTTLLKLRKHLKTQNPNLKTLALILHKCDPTPELVAIFDLLSSSFPIAWITDQPHPYRSFLPTAENLPELIQTWLMELD